MDNSNHIPSPGGRRPLTVEERAARYVLATPPAIEGHGGSNATFGLACALFHGFALPPQGILGLLLTFYNPRCKPRWTANELAHKVRDAVNTPSDRPRGYLLSKSDGPPAPLVTLSPAPPRWPEPDETRIAQIVEEGITAAELTRRSPTPPDLLREGRLTNLIREGWGGDHPNGPDVLVFLKALFVDATDPDPWICMGDRDEGGQFTFHTRRLSAWVTKNLHTRAWLVPARMTSQTGRTKSGKVSQHTLENTGPQRYAVVEFDTGTTDAQAARLWHLRYYAPLALVVHSGGKSLHGWFPVGDSKAAEVNRFMRFAASLGADVALFRNRSQFVRLPGGTRDNGRRQRVLYWDPAALASAPTNGGEAA